MTTVQTMHYKELRIFVTGTENNACKWFGEVTGDYIKHDPERENFTQPPIASRLADLIHIQVTFNAVTRYSLILAYCLLS